MLLNSTFEGEYMTVEEKHFQHTILLRKLCEEQQHAITALYDLTTLQRDKITQLEILRKTESTIIIELSEEIEKVKKTRNEWRDKFKDLKHEFHRWKKNMEVVMKQRIKEVLKR